MFGFYDGCDLGHVHDPRVVAPLDFCFLELFKEKKARYRPAMV